MTKAQARKLERGAEIFNTDTGEVVRYVWSAGTPGDTVFVEGIDTQGRFHVWTNNKVGMV
jgi:phage terminase large subunit-like protein